MSPAVAALALLGPLAVCGILVPFRDVLAHTNAALVLVLVVVGVAATGSRAAGVLAALSSAVWFDVLLTMPYGTLAIADPDDVETAVLLVVVGLIVTEISLWGRRHQARAGAREAYLSGVVTAARIVASGEVPVADLVDRVATQISEVLDLDSCRYDEGSDPGSARLDRSGALSWEGHEVDVDRDGLPTMTDIELPVENAGVGYGRYVLVAATRTRRPGLEQRLVAVTLAEQVGAAFAAVRTP